MIFLIQYFSKDFLNQTNPRVIYTETELENNTPIKLNQLFLPSFKFEIQIIPEQEFSEIKDIPVNTPIQDKLFGDLFLSHSEKTKTNCTLLSLDYTSYLTKEKNGHDCQSEDPYCFRYTFHIEHSLNRTLEVTEKSDCSALLGDFENTMKKKVAFDEYVFHVDPEDTITVGFRPSKKYLYVKSDILKIILSIIPLDYIVNANTPAFFKDYHKELSFSAHYKWGRMEPKIEVLKVNYGINNLKDDKGFIFSSIKNSYTVKKNYEYSTKQEISYKEEIFFYQIFFERLMKRYERIFKKLQNVFADLGGLVSSLIFIGNFIIAQFNKMKLDYDLINKIFSEESNNHNTNKIYEPKVFPAVKSNNHNSGNNNNTNKNHISIIEMNSSRIPLQIVKVNEIAKRDKLQEISEIQSIDDINYRTNKENQNQEKEKSSGQSKPKILNIGEIELKENENILVDNNSAKNKINDNEREEGEVKRKKEENENLKSIVKNLEEETLSRKPLKFTKADFLSSFFCIRKFKNVNLIEKENVFTKAQTKIYAYLDIINYVLLFENFEKLIDIVLNDLQALSFNFIQKRKISEINNTKAINVENTKKIVEYFSSKITESNMSTIDEKLLNGFYPSLINLIRSDVSN